MSSENPTKNVLKAGLKDNIIEIKITCTSEEIANKIFDALESSVIAAVRFDLEQKWENNNE